MPDPAEPAARPGRRTGYGNVAIAVPTADGLGLRPLDARDRLRGVRVVRGVGQRHRVRSTQPWAGPRCTHHSAAHADAPSAGAQITVSGVLIEGLRPTCRVLQTDTRRYALVGPGTLALKEGDHVTVTGAERPDLRNPCGLTLVVSTII